jgi:8-oxo-dGTP pyrophosphatase MutT (NUDIX family)
VSGWREGDPHGRHGGDDGPSDEVAALLAAVRALRPRDAREDWSRRRTLSMLAWLTAPLDQHADPTHVTGSAIVLDRDGRVLLHRHKRLGIWLQPGGHVDPGETVAQAAIRETAEETGVHAVHPPGGPRLVHLDVHQGPRGHVHLDVRYLLFADGSTSLRPEPGESPDVAWFDADGVAAVGDASLRSAVAAAGERSPQPLPGR